MHATYSPAHTAYTRAQYGRECNATASLLLQSTQRAHISENANNVSGQSERRGLRTLAQKRSSGTLSADAYSVRVRFTAQIVTQIEDNKAHSSAERANERARERERVSLLAKLKSPAEHSTHLMRSTTGMTAHTRHAGHRQGSHLLLQPVLSRQARVAGAAGGGGGVRAKATFSHLVRKKRRPFPCREERSARRWKSPVVFSAAKRVCPDD